MGLLPLTEEDRSTLAEVLKDSSDGWDPLMFVQKFVFEKDSGHITRIMGLNRQSRPGFYREIIRYCERSGWSEVPPLIVALLKACAPYEDFSAAINTILSDGPFTCHPSQKPYYVCRVQAELPLLGRSVTRTAAAFFRNSTASVDYPGPGVRVLRVTGPKEAGKTYTHAFFDYWAAVQPAVLGSLYVDLGAEELLTQAADARTPVELVLARDIQTQVYRRRDRRPAVPSGEVGVGLPALDSEEGSDDLPDLDNQEALNNVRSTQPFTFSAFTELQQRSRWTRNLADELVDRVLTKQDQEPAWWVICFDNCDKAPRDLHEFVRRLVERVAGVDLTSAGEGDSGPLRVVLLGDSEALMPNPVWTDHVLTEDLTNQTLGREEVALYFRAFAISRGLYLGPEHIAKLTDDVLARAERIKQFLKAPGQWRDNLRATRDTDPSPTWATFVETATERATPPEWPAILAVAVIEKTLPLDAQVAEKRSNP